MYDFGARNVQGGGRVAEDECYAATGLESESMGRGVRS
jgi:hypothetical protein